MERNPIIQAAEEAAAWAKKPDRTNPSLTNYERVYRDVLSTVKSSDPGVPIVTSVRGLTIAHWACLSRMLVMDNPGLVDRIHPRYIEVLDSQAGIARMQLMFSEVTGRKPLVRSWMHVSQQTAL